METGLKISLNSLYDTLVREYGPCGWWPLTDKSDGSSVYSGRVPCDEDELFEIALGAILTQNVAWINVEKVLSELVRRGALSSKGISATPADELRMIIRPAGYYNQKTARICGFISWLNKMGGMKSLAEYDTPGLRSLLLSVKGIGPETADSIILYAYSRKVFVVDAYTRRILRRTGIFNSSSDYEGLRAFIEKSFRGSVDDYREYHALIVEHSKRFCRKTPDCEGCFLGGICPGSKGESL